MMNNGSVKFLKLLDKGRIDVIEWSFVDKKITPSAIAALERT